MCKQFYFGLFVGACLLYGCTKENIPVGTAYNEKQTAFDTGVVSGWIRIKLADTDRDAEILRTGVFTRGAVATGNPQLDAVADALGVTEVRRVFGDGGRFEARHRRYGLHLWYDLRLDDSVPVSRAADNFAALEGVECAEPIMKLESVGGQPWPEGVVYEPSRVQGGEALPFDDPFLVDQWHYHNDGSLDGTVSGADMNLFPAWKYTCGDPSVVVAVFDSGVDYTHEDLAANMWVNEEELGGTPGVDDDYNGYVDDIYGYSYVNDTGEILPEYHGTHVAGTVAAVNGNGIGVCGVAGGSGKDDGVRIMSIQVLSERHPASNDASDGYVYAADNGAVISQNSWTFTSGTGMPQSYITAIQYFIDNAGWDDVDGDGVNDIQTGPMAGGIVICAAGNSAGSVEYPAADERTVAVTAMGPDFSVERYSCRGPEADIMAPGGAERDFTGRGLRILSTFDNDGYGYLYGTSMACPHVSGVAALIVSHYGGPGFTAERCREILLNSCRPAGEIVSEENIDVIGVGLLDAGAALQEKPEQAPNAVEIMSVEVHSNTISMEWTVPADGNGNAVLEYEVAYSSVDGEDVGAETVPNRYGVGATVSYSFRVDKYNTVYKLNVISKDRFGGQSQAVESEVETGTFENSMPQRAKKLENMELAVEDGAVRLELSEYFTDPDLDKGDVLSYKAAAINTAIVNIFVENATLVLTPLKAGHTLATVTVTDLAGASVSSTVDITVTGAAKAAGGLTLGANPVDSDLAVQVDGLNGEEHVKLYDAAARTIVDEMMDFVGGEGYVNDEGLSSGIYTVAVYTGHEMLSGTFVKK